MARLNWVEVQGFRAFGKDVQRVDLPSSIGVIWGPNSQGKTAFAEAIEFLLTGSIVRRELLASSQDEFADSLRNAHMPEKLPVFIQAEILGSDGEPHVIKRTLQTDYAKKATCSSILEVDGKGAAQSELVQLGVVLSQPPMAAPILMQHTLGYLFTAKPQERSLYFKALLEVGDLDTLRSSIGQREAWFQRGESPTITKLRSCVGVPLLAPALSLLLEPDLAEAIGWEIKVTTPKFITVLLSTAAETLLKAAGVPVPAAQPARLRAIEDLLNEKRSRAFPLTHFDRKSLPAGEAPKDELWNALDAFIAQSAKVDAETKRLTALFIEVLKLPSVATMKAPLTCPVCETEDALTPARVQKIRAQLQASEDYVTAQKQAQATLRRLDTALSTLERAIKNACPQFLNLHGPERKKAGFTLERMKALLPPEQAHLTDTWTDQLKALLRKRGIAIRAVAAAADFAKQDVSAFNAASHVEQLKSTIDEAVRSALQPVVDAQSDTAGWQEFLDIAADEAALRSDLIDLRARETVKKEFTKALKEIDKAKEEVLNDKFTGLSTEIQDWSERLRPEEPVFFSGVKPRPAAQRTIDFKASLATSVERKNPHIRDVVAVFSFSQMHCLGLAAFLARTMREQSGFVVLDDPILSSDDDHRVHFLNGGIQMLLDAGYQVLVLTQDQDIQRDLNNLYAYKNIDSFEIVMRDPAHGTEIDKKSDSLAAMLARAKPYLRNADTAIRKQACERLRDAAERFCKEVIVREARKNGNTTACLTDHDGKNLGQLIPDVEPYLTDPSHPGKLKTIAYNLNPGKHDDSVPNKETLVHAFGELGRFQKDYGF